MSQQRIDPAAGWTDLKRVPRGPNGRPMCRGPSCTNEAPTMRGAWCSAACVHAHRLRTSPPYVREKLLERDHGICAICGLDAAALERRRDAARRRSWTDVRGLAVLRRYEALLARRGFDSYCRATFWDADHITPVVEGGGLCGLDGYRTLCVPCHKGETAALARRRAEARRPAELPDPQTTLPGLP